MPDYSKAKLYKIISPSHPELIFIGSTVQRLTRRRASHRYVYKLYKMGKHHYMPCFDLIKYDDAELILIKTLFCFDRMDLTMKEENYIYNYKKMNKT